jgi:hypothetical protein
MSKGFFNLFCFRIGLIIRGILKDYENGVLSKDQVEELFEKINESDIRYKPEHL